MNELFSYEKSLESASALEAKDIGKNLLNATVSMCDLSNNGHHMMDDFCQAAKDTVSTRKQKDPNSTLRLG